MRALLHANSVLDDIVLFMLRSRTAVGAHTAANNEIVLEIIVIVLEISRRQFLSKI